MYMCVYICVCIYVYLYIKLLPNIENVNRQCPAKPTGYIQV